MQYILLTNKDVCVGDLKDLIVTDTWLFIFLEVVLTIITFIIIILTVINPLSQIRSMGDI